MEWVDFDKPESLFLARHVRTGSTHFVSGVELVVVDKWDCPVLSRLVQFHPEYPGKIAAIMLGGKRVEGRFELRTGG